VHTHLSAYPLKPLLSRSIGRGKNERKNKREERRKEEGWRA